MNRSFILCGLLALPGSALAASPTTHQTSAPYEQIDRRGRISLHYEQVIAHRGDIVKMQLPRGFAPSRFKLAITPTVKLLSIADDVATLELKPTQALGFQAAHVVLKPTDRQSAGAELNITVRADHEPLDRNFVPKLY